jgi:hypothetical protein
VETLVMTSGFLGQQGLFSAKPAREKIQVAEGSSFALRKYDDSIDLQRSSSAVALQDDR